MINLHTSTSGGPTGSWQEVIWQLIEAGTRQTGVMMHLVIPELDKEPVVAYCTFLIRGRLFNTCWQEIYGKSAADIQKWPGEENRLF